MSDNEIIDELKERIKYLENLHDSLRKEIRMLREEKRIILNSSKNTNEDVTLYND